MRNQQGFTLIEVLVAVFILGLVMAGMMEMFNRSSYLVTNSRNNLQAVHLAQGKLEELRAMPYDSITGEGKTPYPGAGGFFYTVNVTSSSLGYDLKTVTVTIYYQERGIEKSLSLTMEKGKR